ncbi:Protein CBR-SUF-1 [Caenorhabditis briggsae]|uniref:Protein CBR-SUF-1 n=1 Tax=Caenorhabditis briggsae TaxID=6238 RepID=A8WNM4_CAEBR|nr:Protein CBR-SUF-1 [Caenorhabditis briggsae]CAP22079.2 Protein CBR-SUF-1 [Caenorhabditis briggsae]
MSGFSIRNPERRIESNPFDVDAWNLLLREHQSRPIDQEREFYESLVTQFPNSGRYWRAYIEHEVHKNLIFRFLKFKNFQLRSKNFVEVEALFQRCLANVLNIDLWKCYIVYVSETKGTIEKYRETMAKTFDFALEKIGMDVLAFSIYQDYIAFLKKVPAIGQYAENQRITAVRRVYQKALATPMHNLDTIWADYCAFEKNINMTLAEKLIAERGKDYQNSRRVEKDLQAMTRGLNRQAVSVPPKGTASESKQVELWKKYIAWEKTNPLGTEEYGQLARRVVYTYEQALLSLGYYPDIWYEAAMFLQEASQTLDEKGDVKLAQALKVECIGLYERAITGLMKESKLLYFAYADFQEEQKKFDAVKEIYNRLLTIEQINPTLTYVQLMRFIRRTEGPNNARLVFKRAREDKRTGYQVFVAAAHMEYNCMKDADVAIRVFKLGLKKYENEPEFGLAYADFLSNMNEDNNTRVVFERILTSSKLPADKQIRIWDRFLDFESCVGDLASILKVEKRRKIAYEEAQKDLGMNHSMLVIDRYKFMDLMPCSGDQLRLIGYDALKGNDTPSTSTSSNPKPVPTRGPQAASAIMGGAGGHADVARYGFPRPDISQMIPFKPRVNCTASFHPVPGGVYPPPPAAAHLMSLLPPPTCFIGPFVNVEALCSVLSQTQLPSLQYDKSENGMIGPMNEADVKKDLYQLLATTSDPSAVVRSSALADLKRKRGDSDEEDEYSHLQSSTIGSIGSRDAYKRRMNKKNE